MGVLNRIDVERGAKGDFAAFFRHPRFRDLCLLKARFTRHRYEVHTHETYVVALVTHGCERLRVAGRQVIAPASSIILVHPEECHDGEPGAEGGWSYRTFYPSVSLMAGIARELGREEPPFFRDAVIDDPLLASALAIAHRTAEQGDADEAEASMLVALRCLILGHGDRSRATEPVERSAASRRFAAYAETIDARMTDRLDLRQLAGLAGVTRFQVIRDFKQMTGLTPGAYIRNRRLRLARRLIEQGANLVQAAAASGFSDQSHLSRIFRSTQGITPRMFRQACMQGPVGVGRHPTA